MGILISEAIYQYIYNLDIADGELDDLYIEDDLYYFSGMWEDYNLEERDGGVYTVSSRASQDGILIGNLEE